MDKEQELTNEQNGPNENGYNTIRDANHFNIHRPVYQLEDLNRDHFYEKPHKSLRRRCKEKINRIQPIRCIQQTLPVSKWLPNYKWKRHFLSDIISGITVAIMHIPQGMAYGLLGGVPPVVGIYMAFFPVLIYFLFGTSRHVSIGTFAIVCLMTGKVVSEYSTVEILQNGTIVPTTLLLLNDNNGDNNFNNTSLYLTNVNVATTVTFTVAIIQLLMYFLRFGIVSSLLSETLVNGFTCASAFHIVSSQLKDLFGLKTQKIRGNFSFFITIYNSIFAIPEANFYACSITVITCTLLILNNEFFKPWLAKKTRFPCPIELVAVILGTLISTIFNLNSNYNISVVGHIPTGLPVPELPTFSLIPDILLDAFVITMVSYTITMSMALIFARKLMYEVDSNQELLALGLSNTVGSFFSCMPVTASLSRSMIQQSVGGVTQLASIVSCSLLLIILLWIGPFFETLPRCVLASIIVVALKGMLFQCTSIIKYWKLNKWDGIVWIVTFCTTLILQIGIGLAAGVAISLLSIFIQGYKPYTCLLGLIPNTDLYVDIKRYKGACELDGTKIFHYSGGLSFASRAAFKELVMRKTGFDAAYILRKRAKIQESSSTNNSTTTTTTDDDNNEQLLVNTIILDFSAVTFIDPSGVELLRQLQNDYNKLDILLFITNCSSPVYEVFKKCDLYDNIQSKFLIFPTIHDAILYNCQLRNNIDHLSDNSQLLLKKNHHE